MTKTTTHIVSLSKHLNNTIAVCTVLLLVACSTTNRQIIVECDHNCQTKHPKANVLITTAASQPNMVVTNSAMINYTK